jgi:hypothetical protein
MLLMELYRHGNQEEFEILQLVRKRTDLEVRPFRTLKSRNLVSLLVEREVN